MAGWSQLYKTGNDQSYIVDESTIVVESTIKVITMETIKTQSGVNTVMTILNKPVTTVTIYPYHNFFVATL